MLINVAISCNQENCGRSECSLLLEALVDYRGYVVKNQHDYGVAADGIILLLDSMTQSVHDAMLTALESLEPCQRSDGKGGYKTVYEPRQAGEEGRAS